jgi:hypothetical protein
LGLLWKYRCYVSADGKDRIRETYDRKSKKKKARFRARLHLLAQIEDAQWHAGYYKKLQGDGDGLWELRFEADNVQQRPLGFKLGDHEFTILFWAEEINDRFVPPNACETALRRKADVLNDRSRSCELWLVLE